ncbi:hypothetical protein BLSMQ_1133 [Brevibacterium aurantiacum]|uniref:Uncharacterized protein n=1 Tax=Brevibacterium aurantiacum TaxID=273384 RepID=A0A1D7W1G3_BREAU|nr:hypothetical protein BLSMQ_1133 [Brevibacterium aurantiacum]
MQEGIDAEAAEAAMGRSADETTKAHSRAILVLAEATRRMDKGLHPAGV